jgi:hypothetical protein
MDLKNDTVAHEATLKAAKQAISKPILIGHWSNSELKSASTQLIANDALEYFLLINDNTADSTQNSLAVFIKGTIYYIKIEM